MAGFTKNKKTIHAGVKANGFVGAGAKGQRHRWDLPAQPEDDGGVEEAEPVQMEHQEIAEGMGDGFGAIGKPHLAVHIHLAPSDHTAFKAMNPRRRKK